MSDAIDGIYFRLTCMNPPLGERDGQQTIFGLQDKKGALEMGARQADGSLVFTFALTAKPGADGRTDFSGRFVQGTPGGRFLYLSLAYAATPSGNWIRRIKVPLSSIRWAQVEDAHGQKRALEAAVDGHRSGTVKLLGDGWVVR